mgnify:CR=1 FL=1
MKLSSVVQSLPAHTHNAGGDHMIVRKNGNTTVIIDESYIQNRTEEQYRRDYEQLQEAAWAIIDELVAAGEDV